MTCIIPPFEYTTALTFEGRGKPTSLEFFSVLGYEIVSSSIKNCLMHGRGPTNMYPYDKIKMFATSSLITVFNEVLKNYNEFSSIDALIDFLGKDSNTMDADNFLYHHSRFLLIDEFPSTLSEVTGMQYDKRKSVSSYKKVNKNFSRFS